VDFVLMPGTHFLALEFIPCVVDSFYSFTLK
jgi:hypothetical protein